MTNDRRADEVFDDTTPQAEQAPEQAAGMATPFGDDAAQTEAAQVDAQVDDQGQHLPPVDPDDPRWVELDAQDWREDGPFDFEEVDLDADEVDRLDFGTLVMTPFDGMQLQLQVDEASQQVQAALVMEGNSAIEVAVFAAPATSSMADDIRREMVEMTAQQGGDCQLAEGPFGTEIRRVIPLQNEEGETMYHVSRTWFVHGPRWLLRGVLMGEAGMTEGVDGPSEVLFEFFRNLVVRRDDSPRVPGDLIPMSIPAELVAQSEMPMGQAEAEQGEVQPGSAQPALRQPDDPADR